MISQRVEREWNMPS